jgi:ferric-dicitrate binding protein FerR (iron transport regulator)
MNHEAFRQLLQRYLRGECSEQEVRLIHRWYDGLEAPDREAIPDWSQEHLQQTMWQRIEAEIDAPAARPITRWRHSPAWYIGLAAAMLIALSWVLLARKVSQEGIPRKTPVVFGESTPVLTFRNETNHKQTLRLQDGSVIVLVPGGQLTYPKVFSRERRVVYLTGNAFFNVTSNPKQPFFVYAGNTVTQVLGTSFWVKTQPLENTVAVEVATGKVSVYEQSLPVREKAPDGAPPANGVVLTPNQRVVYYAQDRHWVTGLVAEPVPISPLPESVKLVFDDAPLGTVKAGLEKKFGIEIVFASENLTHCTFTGDITEMPLYDKLALVCRSIGGAYEVKGTRILVTGQGCE